MKLKKKRWLFCSAIISFFIWFTYTNDKNLNSLKKDLIIPEVIDEQGVVNESNVNQVGQPFIEQVVYEEYELEQDYIEQDNFNSNFCDLTQWKKYQKSALPEIINNLSNEYQRYEIDVTEDLNISVYSANMTSYFKDKFTLLMKGVLASYTDYLNIDLTNKIHLNMVISKDRPSYLVQAGIDGFNPSGSQGVYFGQRNLAFVSYQNEDQAIKTAIHESVHAINLHLLGITSRSFSEGTAEFFEDIIMTDENQFNVLVSNKKLVTEPYLFSLIIQDDEWKNLDVPKLYYSSWAWLSFMMMEREAKTTLQKYITTEQENLCSALSEEAVLSLWRDSYIQFESDFGNWLNLNN
jgi:hypothetical protein